MVSQGQGHKVVVMPSESAWLQEYAHEVWKLYLMHIQEHGSGNVKICV